MILSAKEKQIIIAIKALIDRNGISSIEELEKFGKMYFLSYKLNWDGGITSLIDKGIVVKDIETYSINVQFDDLAQNLQKKYPRFRYWYNEWYKQSEKSEAHSILCERAYGIDLCQTGMMTLNQLEYIIKNIIESDSICLDLGCGSGYITEYISEASSSYVDGIDIIINAIRIAKNRTLSKTNKIKFHHCNMLEYKTNSNKYDYIFLFDTIYFIGDNASELIKNLVYMLKPNGKILIFYSAWKPKDTELTCRGTILARKFETMALNYECIDFTQDEREHWKRKYQSLLKLKEQFISEGNEIIYTNRMLEIESFLKYIREDSLFRYLYIISK